MVLEKHAPFREGRDGKKIIHLQSTAQFTMNSLFSNIFLLIFSNKQRVNHQYYSQTSAGSHPTSWPCWSLRMCSLTFILQLYKSCTVTVGATHPKWPTFLRRTQQLRANVCKNRATGSHGQKSNFAHILSIHTY